MIIDLLLKGFFTIEYMYFLSLKHNYDMFVGFI